MRADGSTCNWGFPTYGDELPHDVRHLIVEKSLGIVNGFWGLVEQGTEVRLIDGQSTLVRGGRPLFEQSGYDLAGLMAAERAVALLAPIGMNYERAGANDIDRQHSPDPNVPLLVEIAAALEPALSLNVSLGSIAATRNQLRDLTRQWSALEDGGAITLSFARIAS